MAGFENTVMIRRPTAEVFAFLADLENIPQVGPFPSRLSYDLDAIPEGTRVTNAVELELRGPGRLLGPVAVPRVRDAVAANLQKLKELLEQ